MAGRKSDFTLPTNTLDDLFSTQEERDDAKLAKIRDIPLTEIDNFPDHPFKVRDDEDMLLKRARKSARYGRTRRQTASGSVPPSRSAMSRTHRIRRTGW